MTVNILKYFIATITAISIVCSCKTISIDAPKTETLPAIGFSNVSTKATVDDVKTNGFGVWAYIKNDVADNVLIMENTMVTYNSTTSSWGYSPLKYWIDNSLFTFLAAYPYEGFNFDLDNSSLNLTLSETPSKVDYLMATNITDTSVEGFSETVDLQFGHILTRVGINIWRDGGKHQNDQMRIKKVTLSNIRKGGTYNSTDLWTPSNVKLSLEKEYEEFSDNIGAAVVQGGGTLTTGGDPADPFDEVMLIPQTMDASNKVSLKIHYQLKRFDGEDKWEEAELEAELPNGTWEPNRRYIYNVVLSSVKDITFYYIQTKISPWGAPQVGGTIIIK